MSNSKSDTFENSFLTLIFHNTETQYGYGASAASGSLYVSLHTSDPTESIVSQETSEADYSGYTRKGISRNDSNWSITAVGTPATTTATNINQIDYPMSLGAGTTLTHFVIGTEATGAGKPLFYGELSAPIAVGGAGIQPYIPAGGITVTEE